MVPPPAEDKLWEFDFDPVALKEQYLAERDKRLRSDHGAQYFVISESEKFKHWFQDPWVQKDEREPMTIETDVLVLVRKLTNFLSGHGVFG